MFCQTIEYAVKMDSAVTMKHKRPGKKKPLTEVFTGRQLRKAVGDFINKIRRIDRAGDRYTERVWDDNGVVLKDVEYPLSEKKGSGSDKPELRVAREAECAKRKPE
ncbi:hypothetical protein [Bradyrhizobium sp. CB3481]|uniref:hypothetical protein n=1 Tax=Bradyrhizobium sp. CB3481 TaxID=3039158 RepID=UPI0024B128EF|nr:hypothetical protein [Bradyrhizobium sp. CB3481]WFU14419.1 hypothetical protein QA643_24900 [Bradyrhizobium sp. CB3481]